MSGNGVIKSTLSADASPFVPRNFGVLATTAAPADSEMYSQISGNVPALYVAGGLPGYYAPYVPTPTIPFYTMQYQCIYPPPISVTCCPLEESVQTNVTEEEIIPSASRLAGGPKKSKKKGKGNRRKDHQTAADNGAPGSCSSPTIDPSLQRRGKEAECNRKTTLTVHGTPSPDFTDNLEFPSLSPGEGVEARTSPVTTPTSHLCESPGVSYSTALKQTNTPRPSVEARPPPDVTSTRSHSQRGRRSGGGDGRPRKNPGGGHGWDGARYREQQEGPSASQRKRAGGTHLRRGRKLNGEATEGANLKARGMVGGEDQRGAVRSEALATSTTVKRTRRKAAVDGVAEKHQFEAPEKVKPVPELQRVGEQRQQVHVTDRGGESSGAKSNATTVRMNASRARKDHSALLRDIMKLELKGLRPARQSQRSGGASTLEEPVTGEKFPDDKFLGATREVKEGASEGTHLELDPLCTRDFNMHDPVEYPPLGSGEKIRLPKPSPQSGFSIPKESEQEHSKAPEKASNNLLKEKGKAAAPLKPLASTNNAVTPKHKSAINMTIADIIVPKQRQPKKLKEKENLLERSSKKQEVQRGPANTLDSSAPLRKRGKERELPARKKLTVMKKIILKEREERKQVRERVKQAAVARQCLLERVVSINVEIPSGTRGLTVDAGELIHDVETPCDNTSSVQEQTRKTKPLHSNRFREYCEHVQTSEINQVARNLITDLVFFQDRLHQKDPIKAKSKRRLVYGLKEVKKYLMLKKLKCVLFAPDIEQVKAEGGLDDSLQSLIASARSLFVPTVFALRRKILGSLARKKVPVSCVGIFDYSGREEQFRHLLVLVEAARKEYEALKNGDRVGEEPEPIETGSQGVATGAPQASLAAPLDDGWVTVNDDSDNEESHPSSARNTDKVVNLLVSSLRKATVS